MWRAADEARVLLMAGQTTLYAIEPRGEYIFGIVAGQPMRSCRGRERRLVQPGQLLAWDPSQAHSGTAVDDRPWSSRLIVVEVADLADLAGDPGTDLMADVALPDPSFPIPNSPPRSFGCIPPWRGPPRDLSVTNGSSRGYPPWSSAAPRFVRRARR